MSVLFWRYAYDDIGQERFEVSKIAFGTWQLGGDWGSFDEDTAIAAIHHARELGVNFFDTAQAYGFGKSEAMLGKALRDELKRDRDDLVIATKGGIKPRSERPRDSRREWLTSGIEDSLRFLDIDHLDLYQIHWPDPGTPAEETLGVLRNSSMPGRSGTSVSPISTPLGSPSSTRSVLSRLCSLRTICSGATSRPTRCRMRGNTTPGCSCTARSAAAS